MKKRALCLLFALLMGLSVLFIGCNGDTQKGQFVPPAFDATAVAGTPTVPENMGYGEIDAKGVYTVGVCGEIHIVDGKADVWFTNLASNAVWLKLRVQDKETGEILGETGLVKPGEYVQSITFTKIPTTGTVITLRVMSYEPDTYYSKGEVNMNTTVKEGAADTTWIVWVCAIGGTFVLILGGDAIYLAAAKKRKAEQKKQEKAARHGKKF